MTMRNQHGGDDGNVTSIEEARKRAAEKAKAAKRSATAGPSQVRTRRDWVVGLVIVAMALGYFATFFFGTPQVTQEGVQ